MSSYRDSHVGEDRGLQYDATHANKVDALIWDTFIKDIVAEEARACAERGGKRYLDFACGTGRVLKIGQPHFDESVGIDISEDMLAVARERIPAANIICADVTQDPGAAQGQFDYVTIFRFILNAERALSMEVLAWLAAHMPTGAVMVVNNHMNRSSFRGIATVLSNALFGTKLNHLSRREVREMLEESGFRIRQWTGYRVLPSFRGKPILGRTVQGALERFLHAVGLGRIGSEHVFVAERV